MLSGELEKGVLIWPKHLSSTAAVVMLELPSLRYVVSLGKIGLLLKLIDEVD